jgi:hypothetical protein
LAEDETVVVVPIELETVTGELGAPAVVQLARTDVTT